MARTYLDFDLLLARNGDKYDARVLASPAGEAAATFALPFSGMELENFRLKVSRRRVGIRRADTGDVEAARNVGSRLFNAVFTDEVDDRLQASLRIARHSGAGLRLRVMASPELSVLPWEFLYSTDLDRFMAVSTDTTLVRYLELRDAPPPLPVTRPLRVLAMVASPHDYPPIEAEREYASLRRALADAEHRGTIKLDLLEQGSLAALQHRLRKDQFHIVHFVGHGEYDERAQEGVLVAETPEGRSLPVNARKLGTLLHDHLTLRLVVLNMCEGARSSPADAYGGAAQALVRAQIPGVIAMQYEISDEAATTFAKEFYDALADGFAVDAALGEARKAMLMNGHGLEWGTPVLYTQSPDGLLFDLAPTKPLESNDIPVGADVSSTVTAPAGVNAPAALDVAAQVRRPPARVTPKGAASPLAPVDLRGQLAAATGMRSEAVAVPRSRLRQALPSVVLLAIVFAVNLGETAIERVWVPTVSTSAATMASALHWLEGGFVFEHPEVTHKIAVYGYSTIYFFVFPALAIIVAWALARRRETEPFRTFAWALALDYLISLPFFVFFPVPERWAYPDSGAILVSDLWTSRLIEAFRPVSGLDNCFPSFHTSMTVVMVMCCYVFRVRMRTTVLALGSMVLASTFALGIHWGGDIVAGTAVGVLSVALAERIVRAQKAAPIAEQPKPSGLESLYADTGIASA